VPETFPESSANSLANTRLTDRELIIHAVQHLEMITGQLEEIGARLESFEAELSVFRPLLAKLAPGGKPDMIGIMQARREARRR
jgi:hypothetical protein